MKARCLVHGQGQVTLGLLRRDGTPMAEQRRRAHSRHRGDGHCSGGGHHQSKSSSSSGLVVTTQECPWPLHGQIHPAVGVIHRSTREHSLEDGRASSTIWSVVPEVLSSGTILKKGGRACRTVRTQQILLRFGSSSEDDLFHERVISEIHVLRCHSLNLGPKGHCSTAETPRITLGCVEHKLRSTR